MSYPYTKPQPRFGFRRRWGDPHVGLVGSGPGRPLRRYSTDAEVGLPAVSGLGASPATPIASGIFNMGPAQGFSRGVFTPDPPWATPRYIASQPDGVAGLGGCLSCGGLGQDETADPCSLEKVKNIIVSKITGNLSSITIDLAVTKVQLDKLMVGTAIKSVLDSLQTPALNAVKEAAKVGISAARTALTTHVTPLIVAAAKKALPNEYSAYAEMLGSLINNAMKPLYDMIAKEIQKCIGASPETLKTSAEVCAAMNLVPYTGSGASIPLVAEGQIHLCSDPSQVPMIDVELFDISSPNYSQMSPVDLSKKSTVDLSQMSTLSAAQSNCLAAGGAWYPGGAECDVDASGNLYNCRAPTSSTTKRYTCVPKSTSGAIAVASSSGSSSSLPLILGAVAIAALLLAKL